MYEVKMAEDTIGLVETEFDYSIRFWNSALTIEYFDGGKSLILEYAVNEG